MSCNYDIAIERINDQEKLAEIVQNDKNWRVRKTVYEILGNEQMKLADIAQNDEVSWVRLAAEEKLINKKKITIKKVYVVVGLSEEVLSFDKELQKQIYDGVFLQGVNLMCSEQYIMQKISKKCMTKFNVTKYQ